MLRCGVWLRSSGRDRSVCSQSGYRHRPRGEFGPGSGHRLSLVSPESAPLERLSKRVCAFSIMSRAASAVVSRLFARASSRVSLAISACSEVSLPTFSLGFLPWSTPASRCLRHLQISDEYRPSRRRYAPPPPCSQACSYAVQCAILSAMVKVRRRRGPSAQGCAGSIGSLWSVIAGAVAVVMFGGSVSRPASGGIAVKRWTQLTLARRGKRQAIETRCCGYGRC